MRAQTFVMLVVCALAAMMLAVSSLDVQDQKCREIAKSMGLDQAQIDKVPRFQLYGPPQPNKDCGARCATVGMTMGFEYFGKQACCCGLVV